jgi:hypothetical protein
MLALGYVGTLSVRRAMEAAPSVFELCLETQLSKKSYNSENLWLDSDFDNIESRPEKGAQSRRQLISVL